MHNSNKTNRTRKTSRKAGSANLTARASDSRRTRIPVAADRSGHRRPALRPGFFGLPKKKNLEELRAIARRFKSRRLTRKDAKTMAKNRQRRAFTASELILLYHEEGLTFFECGFILGIGSTTLARYMKQWDIPTRRCSLGVMDLEVRRKR